MQLRTFAAGALACLLAAVGLAGLVTGKTMTELAGTLQPSVPTRASGYPVRIALGTVDRDEPWPDRGAFLLSTAMGGAKSEDLTKGASASGLAAGLKGAGTNANAAMPASGTVSGSDFARAFQDLVQPAGQSTRSVGGTRLIPVNYSIDSAAGSADAIEIRKPVKANGNAAGKVSLRIVNDTT